MNAFARLPIHGVSCVRTVSMPLSYHGRHSSFQASPHQQNTQTADIVRLHEVHSNACKLAHASKQCKFRRAEGCTLHDDPVALCRQANGFCFLGALASEWTLSLPGLWILLGSQDVDHACTLHTNEQCSIAQLATAIAGNSHKLQCRKSFRMPTTFHETPGGLVCRQGHRTLPYRSRAAGHSSDALRHRAFPCISLENFVRDSASADCWHQTECRTLLHFVSMFVPSKPRRPVQAPDDQTSTNLSTCHSHVCHLSGATEEPAGQERSFN